jgi:hypothetical protein
VADDLRAPFPWFGSKARAASLIWRALGDVPNFVDPFCGSLSVLLARPHAPRTETVNDRDGMVANFWRALAADPDEVARWCDWPISEIDLHARHAWLRGRDDFREHMLADPDFYDAKIAGWWVWGLSQWIGDGWCSESSSQRMKLPLLGGTSGVGVHRKLPDLGGTDGRTSQRGVHRVELGRDTSGEALREYLRGLARRLRRVRVACGDWSRVVTPSVTWKHGLTGIVLDAPYREGNMDYAAGGTGTGLSAEVRAWALEAGARADVRIALCGLEGEHEMPASWRCVAWTAHGGYGSQGETENQNRHRERIWFSPACLDTTIQPSLFGDAA